MFIAVNRFQVGPDSEETSEQVWSTRDSHRAEVSSLVRTVTPPTVIPS